VNVGPHSAPLKPDDSDDSDEERIKLLVKFAPSGDELRANQTHAESLYSKRKKVPSTFNGEVISFQLTHATLVDEVYDRNRHGDLYVSNFRIQFLYWNEERKVGELYPFLSSFCFREKLRSLFLL